MLYKKYEITGHFINRFQRRVKNHCKPNKKSIEAKVKSVLSKLEERDLTRINGKLFAPVILNRVCEKPFYLILADNGEYYSLITIYTEDMFNRRYGKRVKH